MPAYKTIDDLAANSSVGANMKQNCYLWQQFYCLVVCVM